MTVRTIRLNLDPQRRVSNVNLGLTATDCVVETTLELDSHADTCVLGRHALIILDYDRPVSVAGYLSFEEQEKIIEARKKSM